MNKKNLLVVGVSAVAGLAVGAFAGMDSVVIVNDQSLANAAAYTNSFHLNGRVVGVAVKIEDAASAVRTNAVSITSADGQTIFSANVVGTCTNFYQVLIPTYSTGAAALLVGDAPAGATNILYAPQAVASKVTATVTGAEWPTLTNSVSVRLIMER